MVSQRIWERWIQNQTTEVLLVEVSQRDINHVFYVDSPHDGESDILQIPQRFATDFNSLEYVEVNLLTEMPPIATRIVLEPLESEWGTLDISSAVSEHLSNWHTLKANTILSVPFEELGGYKLDILVKAVEPSDLVLLRGEVPLELAMQTEPEQPFEPLAPIPVPIIPELPSSLEETSMLPISQPQPQSSYFVPFSGKGYRLGS